MPPLLDRSSQLLSKGVQDVFRLYLMRLLYLLNFVMLGLQRIKREYPMLQGGIIEVGGQRP
jgi:hypothetical protein